MTEAFAVVWIALYVAHEIADHWLQTGHQATAKGGRGWAARRACARHVATLTTTQAVALTLSAWRFGLDLTPWAVVAGLAVNAATHYWADRRTTLLHLADELGRIIPGGKGDFARLGDPGAAPCGTGAYRLDQSWHLLWLTIAAAITTA